MKRDMMKTVESIKGKGAIPDCYDITAPEILELYQILDNNSRDGKWDALTTAFDYGFILGARAQKAGKFNVK